MFRPLCATILAAVVSVPAGAATLSLAGLVDGDGGNILDVDGSIPLTENWIIGAGAGRGDSSVEGERFSGTSLRARADVQLGSLFANADVERWKDSGQLRATTWRAGLGWLGESGLAASLLVVDRRLDITYTVMQAESTRERQIRLEGNGFGAELGWFGESWTAGARYVDYDYGRNVARIRAARDAAATRRFPRLQQLIASIATRAAGAPDREMSLFVDRSMGRLHLGADWQQQRDAVTRDVIDSAGITLGMEFADRFSVDVMAGGSRDDAAGTVPWGGVALTLRSRR
ncbi:MAG: hypothetical protein M3Y79_03275 [Pseudomonadota bacterium]|nr:hypothetical protein [Pseudomonadota bacterium]